MVRNILVVDDTPTELNRMEKLLSGAGYQVTTATNGRLALEAVKRVKPDCIFMDVNMPEMDGFAATRALRNDAETKDIPVVLVSVKNQKADKAWGQMLGAKGYITKPYEDNELLSIARSL